MESRARGKFAHMCGVRFIKPLIPKILFGLHRQRVEYEGLGLLCFNCGRFGNRKETCPSVTIGSVNEKVRNGEEARAEEGTLRP